MESEDAVSVTRRARELRASLTTRVDVESLLAEASAARQAAAVDADAIVAEAQQVSEELLRDTTAEAERTAVEARERADGLLDRARREAEDITLEARAAADAVRARAEAEVEDHRRRVRTEVTEQVTREVLDQARAELTLVREESSAMIGDLEASVRILGVSLETAQANVVEMLAALDELRIHTAESLGAPSGPESIGAVETLEIVEVEEYDAAPDLAEADVEPEERPRSALEAYLRSAHLEHDDPELPAADDTEVAERYLRDAQRGEAGLDEAGLEEADELGDVEEAEDPGEAEEPPARPLGWLFRNPS